MRTTTGQRTASAAKMCMMLGSSRTYARVYDRVQRREVHEAVEDAVVASGGMVLFSSGHSSAPLYLGIELPDGSRIGLTAYVFGSNRVLTKHRPSDEHRAQIRYGDVNSRQWREAPHPLGFDPAGIDLTLVLVVDVEAGVLIALDPLAYDPLPIGNSIYFKAANIAAAAAGWQVWERDTFGGSRKGASEPGLETIVAFPPHRFLDFLDVERQAQTLQLDQALRYRVAERGASARVSAAPHALEQAYAVPARDILDIIGRNSRLGMAVRGGIAEHHLGVALKADPTVAVAAVGHQEGPPDYWVELVDGRKVTVECKNASPKLYADGTPKVEVQKTRASQGDPASRFYSPGSFDVIAACLFGPTGAWDFRFRRSDRLAEHPKHAARIAPLQRVDDTWSSTLVEALSQP